MLGARRPPAPRRHISSAARFAPKKSTPHPRRSVPCPPPRVIASLHLRSSISRSRGRSRTSRRRDGPRRAPARARRPRRGGDRSDAGESRAHDSRRCSLLAAAALKGRGVLWWGFGHAWGFRARVAVSAVANCIPSYFCVPAWRSCNLVGAVRSGCRFLAQNLPPLLDFTMASSFVRIPIGRCCFEGWKHV